MYGDGPRHSITSASNSSASTLAPLRLHHRLVQGLQERAAVARRIGGVEPAALAGLTQMLVELAHGEGHADRVGGEGTAGRAEHDPALFQCPARQRDIG